VKNNNNLCLFYALELSRLYHDRHEIEEHKKNKQSIPQRLITRQTFDRIKESQKRQDEIAIKIVNELGLDISQEKEYGIEEIIKVQQYYDQKYPGMYRIVLMDQNPEVKPVWKAPLYSAKYEVPIYYEDNHYDALSSIAMYFGGPRTKYCVGM